MELSERKEKILRAIVDDYISTAEPVGSNYILESGYHFICSGKDLRSSVVFTSHATLSFQRIFLILCSLKFTRPYEVGKGLSILSNAFCCYK